MVIMKRIKSTSRYYLFISLLLFSLSCKKEKFEETTLAYEDLTLFDEIQLNSVFDVFLTQDTIYSLKITGSDEIIKQVSYSIENHILSINNEYKPKWLAPKHNKVKLYISSNRPKKIIAKQTCYIETVNPIISDEFGIIMGNKLNMANLELNCNIFYYWNDHPCGGKITLSGTTNILRIWNFAIMSIDARNLTTSYALVENTSKGDCEIVVTDKLEYSIHGTGNIYVGGEPNEIIAKEITSSGKLIELH